MENATILTILGPDSEQKDLAPMIAAVQASHGRLSVLHVGPLRPVPSYSVGAGPYAGAVVPDLWIKERNETAEALDLVRDATQKQLNADGVVGNVATLCAEPAAMHDIVATHTTFADVAVVHESLKPHKAAYDNVLSGILFDSACPAMVNPSSRPRALTPANIMIAWNHSLPASRAVRAALPMLKTAEEVTIACFDPRMTEWADGESPGADLAAWLSHHGCRVTVQEYPSGGLAISDAIIARAREHEADLVVMGAYGRSRWRERLFGGTTQGMIAQDTVPVLMAH